MILFTLITTVLIIWQLFYIIRCWPLILYVILSGYLTGIAFFLFIVLADIGFVDLIYKLCVIGV